jgi:hypothetical protein
MDAIPNWNDTHLLGRKHVEYFPHGIEIRLAEVKALRVRLNWYRVGEYFNIVAPDQNNLSET